MCLKATEQFAACMRIFQGMIEPQIILLVSYKISDTFVGLFQLFQEHLVKTL
jgi:hypothetical protein